MFNKTLQHLITEHYIYQISHLLLTVCVYCVEAGLIESEEGSVELCTQSTCQAPEAHRAQMRRSWDPTKRDEEDRKWEGEKGNESHRRTDTACLYFHFAPLGHGDIGK